VDFEAVSRDFGLLSAQEWFGRRAAWFDPAKLNGVKLGVIA
jgi:hypothetical protein